MVLVEHLGHQFFNIGYKAYCRDGESAERGAHHERLRVGVGNHAESYVPGEISYVPLEFGTERGVLDVVYGTLESLASQYAHPATVSAEMRMIIRAEEQIAYAIIFGYNTA